MCRHSELPQGSKMGTTRAGSAVSMEAEQLELKIIFLSEHFKIYVYISETRNKSTIKQS